MVPLFPFLSQSISYSFPVDLTVWVGVGWLQESYRAESHGKVQREKKLSASDRPNGVRSLRAHVFSLGLINLPAQLRFHQAAYLPRQAKTRTKHFFFGKTGSDTRAGPKNWGNTDVQEGMITEDMSYSQIIFRQSAKTFKHVCLKQVRVLSPSVST